MEKWSRVQDNNTEIEPRILLVFVLELDDECRIIKNKTLMIKEKYVLGCHLTWMDRRDTLSVHSKLAAIDIFV